MCVAVHHAFPDTDLRKTNDMPSSDGLQLSFGDVSGTMTTNNSFGHPCNSYNNARGEYKNPDPHSLLTNPNLYTIMSVHL
jgi:hypothetical protein